MAKRALDLSLAFAGLMLAAPAILIVVVAIRATDGGPVLHGAWRCGYRGGMFRCWKFRTMRVSAVAELSESPQLWARFVDNDFKLPLRADDRTTGLGRVLRRFRLDELPQLWNVLIGEMSLVGPRPIEPGELLWYGPHAREFLSVRPGITGVWQLSGGIRHPFRAFVELSYIRTATVRRDVLLLLHTAGRAFAADDRDLAGAELEEPEPAALEGRLGRAEADGERAYRGRTAPVESLDA